MIEIVAILDRSGSMSGLESDVIGGFNSFIEEQRKLPGKAKVTLALFDNHYDLIHDRVPLNDVPELTDKVYFTRGSTALLDAVGKTLSSVKKKNKGIVFIFTDGQENSSVEYTKDTLKRLIADLEERKWEIHFIGAGIDAFAEGGSFGVRRNTIMRTTATSAGYGQTVSYMTANSTRYRGCEPSDATTEKDSNAKDGSTGAGS